jgi:hypothetical protein
MMTDAYETQVWDMLVQGDLVGAIHLVRDLTPAPEYSKKGLCDHIMDIYYHSPEKGRNKAGAMDKLMSWHRKHVALNFSTRPTDTKDQGQEILKLKARIKALTAKVADLKDDLHDYEDTQEIDLTPVLVTIDGKRAPAIRVDDCSTPDTKTNLITGQTTVEGIVAFTNSP